MGVHNSDLNQPLAEWEEVDVTFPATPGTDIEVPHSLGPSNPEAIYYRAVRQSAPAHVYHNTAFNRKPWQRGYILLRSDVASVKMTLLLWTGHSSRQLPF